MDTFDDYEIKTIDELIEAIKIARSHFPDMTPEDIIDDGFTSYVIDPKLYENALAMDWSKY